MGPLDANTHSVIFPLTHDSIFLECFQRLLLLIYLFNTKFIAVIRAYIHTLNVSEVSSLSSESSSFGEEALERNRFLGGLGVTLCSSTSLGRFVLSSSFAINREEN